MKCNECGVSGKSRYGYGQKCLECDGKGIVEPLTTEEWFCSMTTEEKADFLFDIGSYDWLENLAEEYNMPLNEKQSICKAIVRWLKEEHK